MKKIIAIILAGVGILSAGAAETRADTLVIEQGFFQTFQFSQNGTFSGDNVLVSNINTAGGNFSAFPGQVFDTGILVAGFGDWMAPPPFQCCSGFGTIEVDNVPCVLIPSFVDPAAPDCGGRLTFINPPITLGPPNLPDGSFAGEAPFTMTGQLVLGRPQLPNLIVDIEGSGIVHALSAGLNSNARYEFAAVPEPSSVVLVVSGLVAVGWSRWRGGKRPVSRRRGLADSGRHGDRT
jgi:hypothetical protein